MSDVQEPNSLGEIEDPDPSGYYDPPDDLEDGEVVDQTPEPDLDDEWLDDDEGVE